MTVTTTLESTWASREQRGKDLALAFAKAPKQSTYFGGQGSRYNLSRETASILDLALARANFFNRRLIDPFCALLAFFERALTWGHDDHDHDDDEGISREIVAAMRISLDAIRGCWEVYLSSAARLLVAHDRDSLVEPISFDLRLILEKSRDEMKAKMGSEFLLPSQRLFAGLLEFFRKPTNRRHWPSPVEQILDFNALINNLMEREPVTEREVNREAWREIGWVSTPRDVDFVEESDSERVRNTPVDNHATRIRSSTVPDTPRGSALNFDREASDQQVGLDADSYADCLARLLTSAGTGEFAFAIYGHWGRGKSFLVERLKHALRKTAPGYVIVRYSAWQFPSTPEAWVHLYESFAREALDRPWWQALPTIFRTALKRRGIGGFAWPLISLSLAVVAIGTWIRLGSYLVNFVLPTLGVFGAIWLASWFFKVRSTGARLAANYLSASRHAEKLGLQATIGADLKSLLQGWLPCGGPVPNAVELLGVVGSLGLFFVVSALQLSEFATEFHWPLGFFFLGNVIAIAALWLRWGGPRPDRVLLVVDDLDRCKSEHLLAVVESIKLQLQDPEIAQRVQSLMLVEEDAFKRAIVEKYLQQPSDSSLIGAAAKSAERIAREVGEKLFTAHLRLPPLAHAEALEMLEIFAGRRNREAAESVTISAVELGSTAKGGAVPNGGVTELTGTEQVSRTEDPASEPDARPMIDTGSGLASVASHSSTTRTSTFVESVRSDVPEFFIFLRAWLKNPLTATSSRATLPPKLNSERAAVLEADEIDCLRRSLELHGINDELSVTLGPRSIRALLFRYQLARLLLEQLHVPYATANLADGLVKQCLLRSDLADEPIVACTRKSDALRWVISQVC